MKFLLLCGVVLFNGCGQQQDTEDEPNNPTPTATPRNGRDGQNGASCTILEDSIICPDGTSFIFPQPKDGVDGQVGQTGLPGNDGQDGYSCTVIQTETGATINCQDGTTASINNGTNGIDGVDGEDATGVSSVQFCPNIAGSFPEFGMCINNELYAVFMGANNQVRMSRLTPGTFSTTDGRQCTFTVVEGCTIQ